MTKKKVTDVPRSIWTKLLAGAKARGEDPNFTLLRYASERLLYRVSISDQRQRFVLKGAMLFAAWTDRPHRSTKDLDLLGFGNPEELAEAFKRLCEVQVEPDDGVRFDPKSIRVEQIRDEEEYEGRRVRLVGTLGTLPLAVQVDVGYGDAVTPGPVKLTYPTLLHELPAPTLEAYPQETVIAEKFEAMVKLGIANSRMKDFYDVWVLSRTYAFEFDTLSRAALATFARRNTAWPASDPLALTAPFADDPSKQTQWRAFLERTRASERPSLASVVQQLHAFLSKLYRTDRTEPAQHHWAPDSATWSDHATS